ncbi:tetraprenyl-beta-curcumene synthase family protein [Alteribacter populi]|uniref:tetraprenyl-beta-curcumene synthase family protein n=1 Tax=Alteribacter populi TaxID=2011011 RepID=UPI000BBABB70|nr:tetraprenyl-beta-curcumene synthase family protein [Alteribacter populi]
MVKVPARSWTLMYRIYKNVLPVVHRYLDEWRERASRIPDPELRKQALMSIDTKSFHCEGGAVYGLLSEKKREECIRFIVAYQTISDYLDNLCDRSTSMDPDDFTSLHKSMPDALTPSAPLRDYYQFRNEKEDGGYLHALVKTCQETVSAFSDYAAVQPLNVELATLYTELQVHKHVTPNDRLPRLEAWFDEHRKQLPDMTWYEFSACAGSTLGVYCLTSYAAGDRNLTAGQAKKIKEGYFPWVQGLHIMLDYFIDQEEDRLGGDLNFCFYYENEEEMLRRLSHFFIEAKKSINGLPDSRFHSLINNGLIAIYLADDKVKNDPELREKGKQILRTGGAPSLFFYVNGWMYRQKSKT